MLSFELKGGRAAVEKFFANLKIFCLAESLGGVESLISYPTGMTHLSMPPAERLKRGITDSFVRISVGIENKYDLKEDLKKALSVL
jgi:cystathionine beta-lyase/cystathionine gamma-synthase